MRYEFRGSKTTVYLTETTISITTKGFSNFITKGYGSTKKIWLKHLVGYQLKQVGKVTSGYLQLILPGGRDLKGLKEAVDDENSIVFSTEEDSEEMELLVDDLERTLEKLNL